MFDEGQDIVDLFAEDPFVLQGAEAAFARPVVGQYARENVGCGSKAGARGPGEAGR